MGCFLFFSFLPSLSAEDSFVNKQEKETEELFHRGEKYFFEKKYHIAYSVLLKVLEQKPDHKRALPLVADIAFFRGDFKTALQYYKQAIEVIVQPYKEYYRMGQVYLLTNKPDLAISHFKKSLEYNELFSLAYFQLGYVYLVKKENTQMAKKYWQTFLEQAPDDEQAESVKKIIAKIDEGSLSFPHSEKDYQVDY